MDSQSTPVRRHDLDALRSAAMLLGLVLHAMISFIPGSGAFWPVEDTQAQPVYGLVMSAIHGFRMPLFFLLSGFFTAMLWRKRGLKSLLGHRVRRILVPFLLSMLTITPLCWIVALSLKSVSQPASETAQVAEASTMDSKQPNEESYETIHFAAATGDVELLMSAVAEGADINARNPENGSSPLQVATFFGHAEAAAWLIDAGADLDARNNEGNTVREILNTPWWLTQAIASSLSMELNQAEVEQGRAAIADKLGMAPPAPGGSPIYALFFLFPALGHLWFLAFLCWLLLGFVIFVGIGKLLSIPQLPAAFTSGPLRFAWLIPITMLAEIWMNRSGFNEFGPGTSAGLLPVPSVLAYYAIFFFFGVAYFDADDASGRLGQRWLISILGAVLIAFPLGMGAMSLPSLSEGVKEWIGAAAQATYVWLLACGLMGLFRNLLSKPNARIRYLSDSSYWLYLAHIPLIYVGQFVVRGWPIPGWIKIALICAVVTAILLLMYEYLVRYTPIGSLLNGPKTRGQVAAAATPGDTPGSTSSTSTS